MKNTACINAEHLCAIHLTHLAQRDQIIGKGPRQPRPEVTPHMDIRLEPAIWRDRETQPICLAHLDEIIDIGAQRYWRSAPAPLTAISTAWNGASSTRMPTFSTGVTSTWRSPSRRMTEEKSFTSGMRPMGEPM